MAVYLFSDIFVVGASDRFRRTWGVSPVAFFTVTV